MAIRKRPVSPRQRMINLLYVVLMAMLALNLDPEVMNGFGVIERGLARTGRDMQRQAEDLYARIGQLAEANPAKAGEWLAKAREVRTGSDSLFLMAEELKEAIAAHAGGMNPLTGEIRNREDVEAAAQVMLTPVGGRGRELKEAIDGYRDRMERLAGDSVLAEAIGRRLSTGVPEERAGTPWEQCMFETVPALAAVTMLTKLQADVRGTEVEIMHRLEESVDGDDLRVNRMEAFVIPEALTVVRGGEMRARVVMAAVDTTGVPDVYVEGTRAGTAGGVLEVPAPETGRQVLRGWLTVRDRNGDTITRRFRQEYTVMEPTATVAADMMNVLYAGYGNPVSVAVPGVPAEEVSVDADGASLRQAGQGSYVVTPRRGSGEVMVRVSAMVAGRRTVMAEHSFRVRPLPDPSPYMVLDGGGDGTGMRYRGGPVRKKDVLDAGGLRAAVDDGLLDVPFAVEGFTTVFFDGMGNAVTLQSEGAMFSSGQKEAVRRLSYGARFYVTDVRVTGPDGAGRTLRTPMELVVR